MSTMPDVQTLHDLSRAAEQVIEICGQLPEACLPLRTTTQHPLRLQIPPISELIPEASLRGIPSGYIDSIRDHVLSTVVSSQAKTMLTYRNTKSRVLSMEQLGGMTDDEVDSHLRCYWEDHFRRQCMDISTSVIRLLSQYRQRAVALSSKTAGFSSVSLTTLNLMVLTHVDERFDQGTIGILESAYERSHNLNPLEIKVVADAAGITPQQVRTWFQNKRNRKRKTDPKRSTSTSTATSTSTNSSSKYTPIPLSAPTPTTAANATKPFVPAFTIKPYVDDVDDPAVPSFADTLYPINQSSAEVAKERVIRTLPNRRRANTATDTTSLSAQSQSADAASPESHVAGIDAGGSDGSPTPSLEDGTTQQPIAFEPTYMPGEQYMNMEMFTGDLPIPFPINISSPNSVDLNVTPSALAAQQYQPIPQFTDVYLAQADAGAMQDWLIPQATYVQPLDAQALQAVPTATHLPAAAAAVQVQPALYQLFPNTRYSDTNSMVTDFATLTTTEGSGPVYSLSDFSTPQPSSESEQGRSISPLSLATATPERIATPMEDDPFLGMFIDASPALSLSPGSSETSPSASEYFTAGPSLPLPQTWGSEYVLATAQLQDPLPMPVAMAMPMGFSMVEAGAEWTQGGVQNDENQDWLWDVLPFDQGPAWAGSSASVVSA